MSKFNSVDALLMRVDAIAKDTASRLDELAASIRHERLVHEGLLDALRVGRPPIALDISPTKIPGDHPQPIQPTTSHTLDSADLSFAVGAGILAALLPSIRLGDGQASNIASWLHHNQEGTLRSGVEAILGSSSSKDLDDVPGAWHRFVRDGDGTLSHDMLYQALSIVGDPRPGMPSMTTLFAHLAVDAFGATGVPLPGLHYVIYALNFLDASLPDAKFLSRLAAYRHSDFISSGAASALLIVYISARGIPENSLRRQKLGVICHATCSFAMGSVAPFFPYLAARRSLVNYLSAAMFLKSCLELYRSSKKLDGANDALGWEIDQSMSDLLKVYGIRGVH